MAYKKKSENHFEFLVKLAEIYRVVVAALLVGGLGHEHGADVGDVSAVVKADEQIKKNLKTILNLE